MYKSKNVLLIIVICYLFGNILSTNAMEQASTLGVTHQGGIYRAGAVTMKPIAERPCGTGNTLYAWFKHDKLDFATEGFDQAQREIRALATFYKKECPAITGAYVKVLRPDGSELYEHISMAENWQLAASKPPPKIQQGLYKGRIAYMSAFKTKTQNPDHGLSSYGYYNAELIGQGTNFKLYQAVDRKRSGKFSYVIVHSASSDDEPLFDTDQNASYTGPIFNRELEQIITTKALPFSPYEHINHYIDGYHNPKVDRVSVIEKKVTEPPHFISQMTEYWENGKVFLSPYGLQFVNHKILSKADAIKRFGPSAGETVTDKFALPDFGPLGEDAPNGLYLTMQKAIRSAALKRGLIYKNDAFWSQFSAMETRQVFDSHANYTPIYAIPKSALLMRYLTVNSQRCKSSIKDPRTFKLDDVSTETDEYGNTSTSTNNIYDIVVPGRFAPILEKNFQNQNGSIGLSNAMSFMSGGSIGTAIKDLKNQIAWVKRSQADVDRIMNYGQCGNPVQKQFEEMLYYISLNKKPGEHSSLTFNHSERLSDPLYEPGHAPSFKSACVIDKFQSNFNLYGNDAYGFKAMKWCECVAEKVSVVKPKKINEYTKHFALYQRDLRIADLMATRGQSHPDTRLLSIQPYCAGQ